MLWALPLHWGVVTIIHHAQFFLQMFTMWGSEVWYEKSYIAVAHIPCAGNVSSGAFIGTRVHQLHIRILHAETTQVFSRSCITIVTAQKQ